MFRKESDLGYFNRKMDNFNQDLGKFKEFINHNINLCYINKEMTIEDLLRYIDNIQNRYIPLQKEINKIAEKAIKK